MRQSLSMWMLVIVWIWILVSLCKWSVWLSVSTSGQRHADISLLEKHNVSWWGFNNYNIFLVLLHMVIRIQKGMCSICIHLAQKILYSKQQGSTECLTVISMKLINCTVSCTCSRTQELVAGNSLNHVFSITTYWSD